jgi:hypothetical protein
MKHTFTGEPSIFVSGTSIVGTGDLSTVTFSVQISTVLGPSSALFSLFTIFNFGQPILFDSSVPLPRLKK